jgi:hypothetical protein
MPRSLPLLLLLMAPAALAGQYTPTQDLSLKGLAQVDLVVGVNVTDLAADSAQSMGSQVELALRKAGLTPLGSDSDRRLRPQGRVRFALTSVTHGRWTDDLALRIQVEQTSILARTGEPMLMVTWYAEETVANVPALDVPTATRTLLARGIDRFLKAWLTANGR